ncbi:MAG: DUF1385 domain-containing protein [Bacillota bacterium]
MRSLSRFPYGGQAVIEGVMMRGRKNLAIAVRRAPNDIVLETQMISSIAERYPFLKWPVLRGFIALVEAMVIGVRALTYSANQVVEGEGQGESIGPWEMAFTVAFSLGMGIGLFFLLPAGLAHLLERYATNAAWQNLIEGIFRITIFLVYVVGISFLKDIQRVFQYHGAEHKVIHTYEAGEALTVENARKFSTLHPRCGTSFLLVVMVISILVFSLLGKTTIWIRLLSRIVLLPVVAGLSYEFIKAAGRHQNNPVMHILSLPGMWLQKLTTREPDDEQLEVAIRALNKVLETEEGVESIN